MSISQAFTAEIQHEAMATRRLLEAIPEDKFDWKPHDKSMALGRLGGHIAEMPRWGVSMLGSDELDLATVSEKFEAFNPTSMEALLEGFDQGIEALIEAFSDKDDALFGAVWTLRKGDDVISQMPRGAAIRGFVLSHVVHHRGQLTVYLRLLDVELPSVYGPTADNPSFG